MCAQSRIEVWKRQVIVQKLLNWLDMLAVFVRSEVARRIRKEHGSRWMGSKRKAESQETWKVSD